MGRCDGSGESRRGVRIRGRSTTTRLFASPSCCLSQRRSQPRRIFPFGTSTRSLSSHWRAPGLGVPPGEPSRTDDDSPLSIRASPPPSSSLHFGVSDRWTGGGRMDERHGGEAGREGRGRRFSNDSTAFRTGSSSARRPSDVDAADSSGLASNAGSVAVALRRKNRKTESSVDLSFQPRETHRPRVQPPRPFDFFQVEPSRAEPLSREV